MNTVTHGCNNYREAMHVLKIDEKIHSLLCSVIIYKSVQLNSFLSKIGSWLAVFSSHGLDMQTV